MVFVHEMNKNKSIVPFHYWQNVQLDKSLKPGIRVTVKLHEPTKESMSFVTITPAILWSSLLSFPDPKHYSGEVVSPSIPRVESGVYWGYTVRFAHSFGAVFTESPYEVHRPTCVGTVSLKSWSRPDKVDFLFAAHPFPPCVGWVWFDHRYFWTRRKHWWFQGYSKVQVAIVTLLSPSLYSHYIRIHWQNTIAIFFGCMWIWFTVVTAVYQRTSHFIGMHDRHLLIVFGGLKGLEYSLECDESLRVNDVSLLFHHYLNTCPGQGSRTIRTEVTFCFQLSWSQSITYS